MANKRELERLDKINKRCDILQGYGFQINHLDASVIVAGVDVNFSRTKEEDFLTYAFEQVGKHRYRQGIQSAQQDIRIALGITKDGLEEE